jgi:hypothetical protein
VAADHAEVELAGPDPLLDEPGVRDPERQHDPGMAPTIGKRPPLRSPA